MAVFSSWSDSSGLFRERARLCVYVGVRSGVFESAIYLSLELTAGTFCPGLLFDILLSGLDPAR